MDRYLQPGVAAQLPEGAALRDGGALLQVRYAPRLLPHFDPYASEYSYTCILTVIAVVEIRPMHCPFGTADGNA